ncbi:MAG: hypothetical protein PWP23_364 [Candidatus Sumerlaeota bacterium]|nr:hypothetical protein [Candidatus Sumerlaeota bacterium]
MDFPPLGSPVCVDSRREKQGRMHAEMSGRNQAMEEGKSRRRFWAPIVVIGFALAVILLLTIHSVYDFRNRSEGAAVEAGS